MLREDSGQGDWQAGLKVENGDRMQEVAWEKEGKGNGEKKRGGKGNRRRKREG